MYFFVHHDTVTVHNPTRPTNFFSIQFINSVRRVGLCQYYSQIGPCRAWTGPPVLPPLCLINSLEINVNEKTSEK